MGETCFVPFLTVLRRRIQSDLNTFLLNISSPFDTGLENNLFPPSPTGLENYLTASPPKKTSLLSHLLLLPLYPTWLLRPPAPGPLQVLWPHLSQLFDILKFLHDSEAFWSFFYIWFGVLCAQASSFGNCETMESRKIYNFDPKASESC